MLTHVCFACMRRFQERCKQYGFLAGAEKQLEEVQGWQEGTPSSADQATRRAQKIARFRLEQAAKAKLDGLQMQVSPAAWVTLLVHGLPVLQCHPNAQCLCISASPA